MISPPKLRYHIYQSKLYRTRARYPVVWAGRGSGKTEIAKRKIVRHTGMRHDHVFARGDVPRYFYGLPTYKQAKRVAWESLKRLIPKEWYETKGRTFYESELKIKTKYGVELHVVGLDEPQRIEGNQWCGGVIDECSDQRPGVFGKSVQPALTAFKGWCWRIGVPKRYGVGAEEFKAACDAAIVSKDPDYEAYTWMSETVVTPEELEKIKAVLDSRDYNEQYRASWEQVGGAIFHAFDTRRNVSTAAQYRPDMRIVVSSDFNVDPMCWTLGHEIDGRAVVFDEINIRNTNTPATLDKLYEMHKDHVVGWDFFGDAAGKARKTSATVSDYIHILNDKRFVNKKVFYTNSNPLTSERFAATNAVLCNANGQSRCIIHPRCKRLIADLSHRAYKEGTRDPDDRGGQMGHMSDAFGYWIYRRFPLFVVLEQQGGVHINA